MIEKICEDDPRKCLLTKQEIADYFKVTTRTIEVWMRSGYLSYIKIGRTIRFNLADILAQLRERNTIT